MIIMMMIMWRSSTSSLKTWIKTILRIKEIPLLHRFGGSMKTLGITRLVKRLAEIHFSIYVLTLIDSVETGYHDFFKLLVLLLFAANESRL